MAKAHRVTTTEGQSRFRNRDDVTDLARSLFVKLYLDSGRTANHIAQRCFEAAEEFEKVARRHQDGATKE